MLLHLLLQLKVKPFGLQGFIFLLIELVELGCAVGYACLPFVEGNKQFHFEYLLAEVALVQGSFQYGFIEVL
jgi:hypothetical protein